MRRAIPAFFILALSASLGLVALGQDVHGPAGTYTVKTPGPATITQGEGWIRFEWAVTPRPTPSPDPPAPPAPTPTPVIRYTGRLYLSYIAYESPTQEQVAFRAKMAAVDWSKLNAVYRSYLEVEPAVAELRLLGDRRPPVLVIQHQPPGAKVTDPAPIVDEIAVPTSVDDVKARVAKLRGQ